MQHKVVRLEWQHRLCNRNQQIYENCGPRCTKSVTWCIKCTLCKDLSRLARITERTQCWDPILVFVCHNLIFYVGAMILFFGFYVVCLSVVISGFLPSQKHFMLHCCTHWFHSFHFWCSCLCKMLLMLSPF